LKSHSKQIEESLKKLPGNPKKGFPAIPVCEKAVYMSACPLSGQTAPDHPYLPFISTNLTYSSDFEWIMPS